MSGRFDCCADYGDFMDDAMEHVLPWYGGDVPGAETGYSLDMIAEQNEPPVWAQPQYDGLTQTPVGNASLSSNSVFESSYRNQQSVFLESSGYTTSSIAGPSPSMYSEPHVGFQPEIYGNVPPFFAQWSGPSQTVNTTTPTAVASYNHPMAVPEQPLQTCPYPTVDHPYYCQGHGEDMPSSEFEETSDSQLHYNDDNGLLLPQAAPAMERGNSYASVGSATSSVSRISTDSSGIQKTVSCPRCNTTFKGTSRKRNLHRHMQTSHAEGRSLSFPCPEPYCVHSYKRGDALRVHQVKAHPDRYPPPQPRPKQAHPEG